MSRVKKSARDEDTLDINKISGKPQEILIHWRTIGKGQRRQSMTVCRLLHHISGSFCEHYSMSKRKETQRTYYTRPKSVMRVIPACTVDEGSCTT
jgi:hypothetical protein